VFCAQSTGNEHTGDVVYICMLYLGNYRMDFDNIWHWESTKKAFRQI